MKYFFSGCAIMNQTETNFSSNKHTNCNRIMNKDCMNYCTSYWKHQNEIAQNLQVQKRRMHEWFK